MCPYPECGRGFSVYSNMRRHTRLHTQDAQKQNETSGEEGGDGSNVSNSPPMSSAVWPPKASSTVLREGDEKQANATRDHDSARSPNSLRAFIPTISNDSINNKHAERRSGREQPSTADGYSESRWKDSISQQTAASQSFFSK